jgi:hypothetical protein
MTCYKMKEKAEKTKRDLFVGKCVEVFGKDEVAKILEECKEPFAQIDKYYAPPLEIAYNPKGCESASELYKAFHVLDKRTRKQLTATFDLKESDIEEFEDDSKLFILIDGTVYHRPLELMAGALEAGKHKFTLTEAYPEEIEQAISDDKKKS